ncbi:alpha/beta hydrolase [Salinibacterium sp. ZJ454]|uniref:alpha/beta fold hydrolase n=1 Tax=Salinibacterium sp. ZJ454 TaxID=2708339 RepID=UPI00141DBE35|nr:alpha/beta hydrolase [Salinibacterium sp. ZJ454]
MADTSPGAVSTEPKVYVLLHGCYLGGWSWKLVAEILRSQGHRVLTPTLDGCGERQDQIRPGIDTESQAAEIAHLLRYEDLWDIVLVGTSTGGMVVAKVAETVPERISRLVFVDALLPEDGQCVNEIVAAPPLAYSDDVGMGPSAAQLRARTLAGLDSSIREWAIERVTRHPSRVITKAVQLPRFFQMEWQATVIWCRQSLNPGEKHQRQYASRLGAEWRELDAGHYPFLSAPAELAHQLAM